MPEAQNEYLQVHSKKRKKWIKEQLSAVFAVNYPQAYFTLPLPSTHSRTELTCQTPGICARCGTEKVQQHVFTTWLYLHLPLIMPKNLTLSIKWSRETLTPSTISLNIPQHALSVHLLSVWFSVTYQIRSLLSTCSEVSYGPYHFLFIAREFSSASAPSLPPTVS